MNAIAIYLRLGYARSQYYISNCLGMIKSNTLFLSNCALVIGVLWMASEYVKTFLEGQGIHYFPEDNLLLIAVAIIFVVVIKKIRFLIGYTDEALPLYICLLGAVLAIAGAFVFTRLMLLGCLCLVAGAYWSRGTVNSYFR